MDKKVLFSGEAEKYFSASPQIKVFWLLFFKKVAIWGIKAYSIYMIVAKFGGSSLSSAEKFLLVAEFVKRHEIPVVIASAPGGEPKVTDLLISAYRAWEENGDLGCDFAEAEKRLSGIASGLKIDIAPRLASIKADINAGCGFDYAVSRGEHISAYLLSKLLGYAFIDAKECIKLTESGKIDLCSTEAHSVNIKPPCVIPGFYGYMPSGKLRLLSRGGSDISGALIASVIGSEYWKCTDVEGIFDGYGGVIDHLSYDEAELLCYFGASVMQYKSLAYLKKSHSKLVIRGTCIDKTGTVVSDEPCRQAAKSSKRMLYAENVDIGYIEDCGLLGKSIALIDDMGFSQAAIRRILGESACFVTVTAAIGPYVQGEVGGLATPLITTKLGRLYVTAD